MSDRAVPHYLVRHIALRIELSNERIITRARLHFMRNGDHDRPLVLDGEGLALRRIALGGRTLQPDEYCLRDGKLVVSAPAADGVLTTECVLRPGGPGLSGPIAVGETLVTHCEPEGFRRITFFPDRPDIMATYRCTLVGGRHDYPVMLANGRAAGQRALADGRTIAVFDDRRPKPSYLFAFAAGKFDVAREHFRTRDGRDVALLAYAAPSDLRYCRHGLATLRAAMAWDEQNYGRVYDADVLRSVIIPGYPGGAMENPTLNLYASEFFLAAADISTASELGRLSASVAHEYFHDWTGNHVGIRSWRELTLKEGLTVLREQQFMADRIGTSEARLDQVAKLEAQQYPEDDGALAHAPRPAAAAHPANLYTRTVYEKGAEIMRLIETRLGAARFKMAVSGFLDRFDGKAATLEEFLEALDPHSEFGLGAYLGWFGHAGAVRRKAAFHWSEDDGRLTIELFDPAGSGAPLPIAIRLGLIAEHGTALAFDRDGKEAVGEDLLFVGGARSKIELHNVRERPVASILRGLSAPVRLDQPFDVDDWALLARHDDDPVNRWRALQELAHFAVSLDEGRSGRARQALIDAYADILRSLPVRPGVAARLLRLPQSQEMTRDHLAALDDRLARFHSLRLTIADALEAPLLAMLRLVSPEPAAGDPDAGLLRLRSACLGLLAPRAGESAVAEARNMLLSDTMEAAAAGLQLLVDAGGSGRDFAVGHAFANWADTPTRLDNLYAALGSSSASDAACYADDFFARSGLDLQNPARIKAFFDRFAANPAAFHGGDGAGYRLMLDMIHQLRSQNPGIAARLVKAFAPWRQLDTRRRETVHAMLTALHERADLSPQLADRLSALLAPRCA